MKPLNDGIGQVHVPAAQVNAGQAVLAFEILDHVSVASSTTDFGNAEEADQFFLGHDSGTGAKSTVRIWQNGCELSMFLGSNHSDYLDNFCWVSAGTTGD
jgi:hypothetical protein